MDELLERAYCDTADAVEAWRLEQLLAAGYPIATAEQLAARQDIDLHRALDLVARGCDPELAGRILL
jgi:hypothetical protein